jgi:glycosyltransferase involved in cell wall biosynthesis
VRVSVVIPTYKRPKELERAVNSVLNNGYEDVEVLIGYDGEKYGEFKDERVKTFLFKHTGNPSFIRNRLVELASGELITFLDDDDEYLPGKIGRQVRSIGDFDAVFCNILVYNIKIGKYVGPAYKKVELKFENFLYIHKKFGVLVHVNAWMMRKEFFLRIGGFDERLDFGEDWEFGVRVFKNGRVKFDNFLGAVHYMYRTDGLNVNVRNPEKFLKAGKIISEGLRGLERIRFLNYVYGVAGYKLAKIKKKKEAFLYSLRGLFPFPNTFALRGIIRALIL